MPKHGPNEGSRRQTIDLTPILLSPSFKPTDVVVLPSPAGVGVTAVTRTIFPLGLSLRLAMYSNESLAL